MASSVPVTIMGNVSSNNQSTDPNDMLGAPEWTQKTDHLGHPLVAVTYECGICMDDFPLTEGVVTCAAHFICKECMTDIFSFAVQGPLSSVFPVQCCEKADDSRRPATVLRRRFQHLLPPDVDSAYARREVEYYTPPALKLYCVDCRTFLPPKTFQDKGPHTMATCECDTTMCVGCKGTWAEKHRCVDTHDPLARPDWLPEYTEEFRVKKCPGCKMYIEHELACNHMTCQYCRHEFCFICLLPWSPDQTHEEAGCPMYGDPACGYDGEGYENSGRGLHRDTGLTRDGLDRKGDTPIISDVADALLELEHRNRDRGWDDNWDNENWDNHNDDFSEHHDDHGDWNDRYDPEEEDPTIHIDPEELADQEYRTELEEAFPSSYFPYQFPGEVPSLNFQQIECPHVWKYNDTYGLDHGAICAVCDYYMDYFNYECTACGVTSCDFCHSSWAHRVAYYNPAAENMVTVMQFAENGEVPYKAHRRAFHTAMHEADAVPVWSVSVMFKEYEKLVLEADPFYYGELGIFEMFEEAEEELSYHEWYVEMENVGVVGNTMTFNLHNNGFAPLFWDERE